VPLRYYCSLHFLSRPSPAKNVIDWWDASSTWRSVETWTHEIE
jgi:hypothetical protein